MRTYTVVLIPDPNDGAYTVIVPALPGLVSQGETIEDALTMAQEAITFHLECLAEQGEPIPDEGDVVVERVEVAVA